MFGKHLKDVFCDDEQITFLNHGSYGKVPLVVETSQIELFKFSNRLSSKFAYETSIELLKENLEATCEMIGIPDLVENAALINNVTSGVNSIFRNFIFEEGDTIITTSMLYGAYPTLVDQVCDENKLNHLKIDIRIDDNINDMIDKFKEGVAKSSGKQVFAFVEWIASSPALLYPIEEIIDVLHEKDCTVMIDAAHVPGQIPKTTISKIIRKSDIFVADIHKWSFCVRGCAILVVSKTYSKYFYPNIVSWHYNDSTPFSRFHTLGTEDRLERFSVIAARKFMESIGGFDEIHKYCCKIVSEIVEYIIDNIPESKLAVQGKTTAPYMRLISLPPAFSKLPKTQSLIDEGLPLRLMKHFQSVYKMDLLFVTIEGELFLRISGSVYNSIDDAIAFVNAYYKYINQ